MINKKILTDNIFLIKKTADESRAFKTIVYKKYIIYSIYKYIHIYICYICVCYLDQSQ